MIRNTAFKIYDFVTFQISKVLETLFDEIEYRLAKYRSEKRQHASPTVTR